MNIVRIFILFAVLFTSIITSAKETVEIKPSYAWTVIQPLGLRTPAPIDSSFIDYSMQSVPSAQSAAWATTGNLGAPGINLIYSERKPMTDFFFADAIAKWIPSSHSIKFYNTRIPMTVLSYNFGGDNNNFQDRLQGVFSGNVNKQLQFGAIVDYLFSKGSYDNQSTKNFTWGFNASYIGEKFEVQFYQSHYNLTNRENGGIENDLYITDPGEIQGGNTTVNPKSIPTNLTQAQDGTRGSNIFINAKYKIGFWREIELEDSSVIDEYVPVTAIIWTLNWNEAKHNFRNINAEQGREFWAHRYLSANGTDDFTTYSSLKNTFGVSMLEGFNKYVKFGLAAYASFDVRTYHQTPHNILYREPEDLPAGIDRYYGNIPISDKTEGQLNIGVQLTKQQGYILKYEATADLGMTGRTAGDFKIDGIIHTQFPFLRDSLYISAFGGIYNETPSYFVEHYISNHFIWDNDFSKTRRFKAGGELYFPRSGTSLKGEIENINNPIYFNNECLPSQYKSNVQIITLILQQNFTWRALHWDNRIILQKSTNHDIIPIPKFAIYSNLYIKVKIAKALDLQLGTDIDYYAKHRALGYQPATMTFYNDTSSIVGGFPFMNAYANMKLGKVRFYVMYSHINDGLFGKSNYFSIPHYPLNPGRFQLGLSVQFAN